MAESHKVIKSLSKFNNNICEDKILNNRHRLIIPFALKNELISNANRATQVFKTFIELLNFNKNGNAHLKKNLRFNDYIEDLLISDDTIIIDIAKKFLKNKNNSINDYFPEKIKCLPNTKFFLKYSTTKLFLFECGIGFLVISYSTTDNIALDPFDFLQMRLSIIHINQQKQLRAKEFLNIIFNDKINFFDAKDPDKIKDDYVRFTTYTQIYFEGKETIDFDNQIAWLLLNSNSLRNEDPCLPIYKNFCDEGVSYFGGNKIFCSEEGACYITHVYEKEDEKKIRIRRKFGNYDFVAKTYQTHEQNFFLTYLFVLCQTYMLHKISGDAQIAIKNISKTKSFVNPTPKIINKMHDLENEYLIFRSIWMYDRISNFLTINAVYEYIKTKLRVKDFLEEVKYTLEPICNKVIQFNDMRIKTAVGVLGFIAISNATINIVNYFYKLEISLWFLIGIPIVTFSTSFFFLSNSAREFILSLGQKIKNIFVKKNK